MSTAVLLERIRKIFGKALIEDQRSSYLITLYEDERPEYILCIPTVLDKVLYGKIDLLDRVYSLSCLDIYYSPSGLYVFARSVDEFVEKLKLKLKLLRSGR